jgi:hypothetical protein
MNSEKSILLKTLKLALCIGLVGEKRNSEETYATIPLKVPKCEILDGSDCHNFYTTKTFLWVGEFGAKI